MNPYPTFNIKDYRLIMRDAVSLQIGDHRIENFQRYSITCNLFEAADSFEFTLANPEYEINAGDQCKLYVNDRLELNGILDKVTQSGDKSGERLLVEGRDLMGLIVDSYAEDYTDNPNEDLKSLAERLLQNIKVISRVEVQYGKGSLKQAVPITDTTEDYEFTEVMPAETIFEILRRHATSRGLVFFALPDGTLVFGEPVKSGAAQYALINRTNGQGNNILEWEKTEDISKRYSKITVIGERQLTDDDDAADAQVSASITDPTFPPHLYKPFVARIEHDADRPEKYARILMENQQFDGHHLRYKTPGHSQTGKNWEVNTICHVMDERLRLDADYLIYGRTFELSRDGVFTSVLLSKLGIRPA